MHEQDFQTTAEQQELEHAFQEGKLSARLQAMLTCSLPENYVHTEHFAALAKDQIPSVAQLLSSAPAPVPLGSAETAEADAEKLAADLRAEEVQRKAWLQNFEHDMKVFEAAWQWDFSASGVCHQKLWPLLCRTPLRHMVIFVSRQYRSCSSEGQVIFASEGLRSSKSRS